jgi:hypothetical protein
MPTGLSKIGLFFPVKTVITAAGIAIKHQFGYARKILKN